MTQHRHRGRTSPQSRGTEAWSRRRRQRGSGELIERGAQIAEKASRGPGSVIDERSGGSPRSGSGGREALRRWREDRDRWAPGIRRVRQIRDRWALGLAEGGGRTKIGGRRPRDPHRSDRWTVAGAIGRAREDRNRCRGGWRYACLDPLVPRREPSEGSGVGAPRDPPRARDAARTHLPPHRVLVLAAPRVLEHQPGLAYGADAHDRWMHRPRSSLDQGPCGSPRAPPATPRTPGARAGELPVREQQRGSSARHQSRRPSYRARWP